MKIFFISLGCDKNLTNSEEMLGLLIREGHCITDEESEADIIVVNTCAFIGDAKEESINTILEMASYKSTGKLKSLIVTGCLAERYKDEILKEIPEVDAVVGTTAYDRIIEAISASLLGTPSQIYDDLDKLVTVDAKRVLTRGGYYAHLKIAEGCNKRCTYCIIPKLRGNYRSVPMERLINEAKDLAEYGVKELILVAQETTMYGIDLYKKKSLHVLLKELCKINGIQMIRIMYCYPEEIYDELICTIRDEEKICKYIDMPIQHCNNEILSRMGRKTTKEDLLKIIGKLREEIKDVVLRTTLITGFPGETKEQHEEMLDFVEEVKFERLGVFSYSPEEDTVAASMPNQISDKKKNSWRNEIMELQQDIMFENGSRYIGRTMTAIIDGKLTDENVYVGRTYMDCPDIDGNVFIDTDTELISGDIVKVKITMSKDYDLIGVLI